MDPFACWLKIMMHLDDGDIAEAYHALCDLDNWFQKGGFRINTESGWPSADAVKTLRAALSHACESLCLF